MLVSVLLVVGGVGLFSLSVSRWWVQWLDRKGSFTYWFVQYGILFGGIWALGKGGTQLLDRMLR